MEEDCTSGLIREVSDDSDKVGTDVIFLYGCPQSCMPNLVEGLYEVYACESWILTAELQRRIQAIEMRCYRKILHISYKDHVTNEEVRAKIQQAIGPHEGLLTIVKRRKLQWYGHVSRSSGLAKNILQGTVKGGRRQGRQRRRWEDNIREWTGLEFGKSQRAVENREKWRKQVAKNICSAPRTHAVKGLMMIMMMYFHLCSTTLLHC